MYHKPVLLSESIEGLNIQPEGVYVDVTFGGGGHSAEILTRLTTGRLIAFDQDEDSWGNAPADSRFTLVEHNFKFLKNYLRLHNAVPVDGILADLGVSSHQFDTAERGFSTRFDAPLDLRMDRRNRTTAADILNSYSEENLKQIFKEFGELENAGKLASLIAANRIKQPIDTTGKLRELALRCTSPKTENQYLAKLFQALRVEVNAELEVLRGLLSDSLDMLRSGGRLVVISYNSLEDRMVKNFMRSGNFEGEIKKDFFGNILTPFHVLTRHVVVPGLDETGENNRSRSAKLRIAEKK